VATGRPLGGRDVVKGHAIYFAFENPTDIQMRWLGLTQEMRIDPEKADVHFVSGVPRLLPNGPAVLLLAHPTKNAVEPDGLVPKGGGAFLNEVDGNIGLMKRENVIGAQVVGKFRGPDFGHLSFELKAVRHPILKDSRGRDIPTVIAQALDEAGRAALDAAGDEDENKLLRVIEKHPRAGLRTWSVALGWKHHSKVQRIVDSLAKRKFIKQEGRAWVLTQAGQKELYAQESTVPLAVPRLVQAPPLAPLPR
jgi:hypothetical protein